jgi:CheY-like chemotaxis protein
VSALPIEVLIVEDDEDLREAMVDMLSDEGYTTACAGNGLEALEWLSDAPAPKLILLDLMMPVMDGWQFRAEQRKSPALLAIPLVVLSASSNLVDDENVECLRKPAKIPALLALLERYCGPRAEGG